eukprot:scaffold24611_cov166-Cylindrotheca_fusiformis.AAC.2
MERNADVHSSIDNHLITRKENVTSIPRGAKLLGCLRALSMTGKRTETGPVVLEPHTWVYVTGVLLGCRAYWSCVLKVPYRSVEIKTFDIERDKNQE